MYENCADPENSWGNSFKIDRQFGMFLIWAKKMKIFCLRLFEAKNGKKNVPLKMIVFRAMPSNADWGFDELKIIDQVQDVYLA